MPVLNDETQLKGLDTFQGFCSFRSASNALLKYLHQRLGFQLWMVTRVTGDDWIVLQAEDRGYGVATGDVFRWTDSFCSRMVKGFGPCIAPRSIEIDAYAAAPIGQQVPISAYIGVPLMRPDGGLFGTLCAIDPETQSDDLVNELPQLEMLSRMLGTILHAELKVDEQRRRAERAEAQALTDSLTGLCNRRAWDRLILREEERCSRYGHQATVVSIDLDRLKETNDLEGHAAGDALLTRLAAVLKSTCRETDIMARVGGDEFAILAADTNHQVAAHLVNRLESMFEEAGTAASIGYCQRRSPGTLIDAWKEADARMYEQKSSRRMLLAAT